MHKLFTTLALLVSFCTHNGSPPMKIGIAKHYDPGRMPTTAANRGLTLPPGYAGFASVQECDYGGRKDAFIGRTVWASINGGPWGRFIVADCSAPRDRARHKKAGLIIEVSYGVAKQQGWAGDRWRPAQVIGYER